MMVVLFPVPGLLANRIQKVQKETMKRVSLSIDVLGIRG